MSAWIALAVAGVGCFALRFGVVAVIDRRAMPAWLDRAAGFVMPASFAALCAGALVGSTGDGSGLALPVAGVATGLVASRRSPSVAVVCGMVVLWTTNVLTGWH